MRRRQTVTVHLLLSVLGGALLGACGGSTEGGRAAPPAPPGDPAPVAPSISRFAATDDSVFVGDHTQLTAVFSGESAEIDGLGPVASGTPIDTPVLAATRTFTLTVHLSGQTVQATVTVVARYRDRVRQLADAAVARKDHVAVALPDGSALVMGGNTSESINVPDANSSSRFDPASEAFAGGPDLAFSAAVDTGFTNVFPLRTGFLLAGGVINAGVGLDAPGTVLSQTFDPAMQKFTRAGDMKVRHLGTGNGALLADGRVLLTGGGLPGIAETEIYDPASRTWTTASPMGTERRLHTVTLLRDGRVLIAGGFVCCVVEGQTVSETATAAAELFDPATGNFTPTGSMAVPRALHQATLLPDGRVLLSGGVGDGGSPGAPGPEHAEVYDPATGTFSAAGDLQSSRFLHTAILLTDGRVLAVGGVASPGDRSAVALTELYDPATNAWAPGPTLQAAFPGATATLLGNGKVLIFGGESASGFPVPKTLLFE
ncbi:MAG TPA: kelch repeat-containing protein [Myxococcaceae bacterium]